ncbi:MAG: MBL fold metallo-hydrolase [Oribacterium sp.]|nr:MBL fold metallo-hydrolase [Oribacterium sp.]
MKKKAVRILVSLIVFVFLLAQLAYGLYNFQRYMQSKNEIRTSEVGERSSVVPETIGDEEYDDIRETYETGDLVEAEKWEEIDEKSDSPAESFFEIHFFDVGEADSTLVECDGHRMLIDGGKPSDSQFLYSYMERHGIDYLDYIVCTHAHEDHVGGLAGALNFAKVGIAYAPVTEYDSRAFNSFIKYLSQQEKEITVPKAGEQFTLGSANVIVLAPIDMHLAEDNINNSSIVLHIDYGNTSFTITGDAEEAEEVTILDAGYELSSTVLRVGHHGSQTSTSQAFLTAVKPQYCVISVGKGNQYDHPHEVTLQKIQESGAIVYRTDINGEITCISDGDNVTFITEK